MDVEMYLNPKRGEEESLYLADPAVAKAPFTRAAVVDAALDRGAIAEGILASHFDTGHSSIDVSVSRAGPDVLVSILDPRGESNGGAAMGIERNTRALSTAFGFPPIRGLLAQEDTGFTFTRGSDG